MSSYFLVMEESLHESSEIWGIFGGLEEAKDFAIQILVSSHSWISIQEWDGGMIINCYTLRRNDA